MTNFRFSSETSHLVSEIIDQATGEASIPIILIITSFVRLHVHGLRCVRVRINKDRIVWPRLASEIMPENRLLLLGGIGHDRRLCSFPRKL